MLFDNILLLKFSFSLSVCRLNLKQVFFLSTKNVILYTKNFLPLHHADFCLTLCFIDKLESSLDMSSIMRLLFCVISHCPDFETVPSVSIMPFSNSNLCSLLP